jgi:hypothetical protein
MGGKGIFDAVGDCRYGSACCPCGGGYVYEDCIWGDGYE